MNLTIELISNHPNRGWLLPEDLDIDVDKLIRRFAWVVGAEPDTPLWQAVCRDVRGDADLCIALHQPPDIFISWLEMDDLSIYEIGEVLGEDWFSLALTRAGACEEWPDMQPAR